MKFLASALLVLLFVPVELAMGQEPSWNKPTRFSPDTKIEVVDALSGVIQGELVSIAGPAMQAPSQQTAADVNINEQLIHAVEKGDAAAVEPLLAGGANVNAETPSGNQQLRAGTRRFL